MSAYHPTGTPAVLHLATSTPGSGLSLGFRCGEKLVAKRSWTEILGSGSMGRPSQVFSPADEYQCGLLMWYNATKVILDNMECRKSVPKCRTCLGLLHMRRAKHKNRLARDVVESSTRPKVQIWADYRTPPFTSARFHYSSVQVEPDKQGTEPLHD